MDLIKILFYGLIGLSVLSIASLFIPGFNFPLFFLFFPLGFGLFNRNDNERNQPDNYIQKEPPGPRYCDNCGMRIIKRWNYCPNCSNPLEIDTEQYR